VRDADVRNALHALLRVEHEHEWTTTRIFNELSLCGEVRVDVAVLNGRLAGYELKSARDTLKRLPTQVSVYSRVLDEATLVVAERHFPRALAMVPEWWGVVVAWTDGDGLRLEHMRAALHNPTVDTDSVVRLLWRDEVLDELVRRGLGRGARSKTRSVLARSLVAALSGDEVRAIVRDRMKQRGTWRAAPSPRRDDGTFPVSATRSDFLH